MECVRGRMGAWVVWVGLVLGVLAVVGGLGWWGWTWWEAHRPRVLGPNVVRMVEVVVDAPVAVGVGVDDKDLRPGPLVVRFVGAPVAPLERVGKEAAGVAVLKPAFAGKWKWRDGGTLVFEPEGHWPPGVEVEVAIRELELAQDVVLDRRKVTVRTAPMAAAWSDVSFYNSPVDPAVFQVVGELRVSHPVGLDVLQRQLRMDVVGGTRLFGGVAEGDPVFTVTADPKSARRYFIRSRAVEVPAQEDWVKLVMPAGVVSAVVGEPLAEEVVAKVRVPDKHSGLEITGVEPRIVRTGDGEPQQFVMVKTNLDIDSAEVAKRIGMWWHPDGWVDADGRLAFEERQAGAVKVGLVAVEGEAVAAQVHAFRFLEARREGALLVRVEPGVRSPGGFEIVRLYEKVVAVPPFPKEVRLLGKGNVLALDGERKLAVESRGVKHLRISLRRVPPGQFQHLVSMNRWNSFGEPSFDGQFNEARISQRWSKVVEVPVRNDWEACVTAVDLAEAPPLNEEGAEVGGCGVFFVVVEAVGKRNPPVADRGVHGRVDVPWDEEMGERDWYWIDDDEVNDGWAPVSGAGQVRRLVMATDLGMLAKRGADGSRDVYVMSLGGGVPVAGVELRVVALNGVVLESVRTDEAGYGRISALEGCVGDRRPVALVAAKGGDITFLSLSERQLPAMDYSRFDVGGVMASRIKALEALVFTERGVYRPGDTVHVGMVVRRRDWQPVIEGLPLAVSMMDGRGRQVGREKMRVPYDGMLACDFVVPAEAPLGTFRVVVEVLDERGDVWFRLGQAALRVEEFQPDRMKVAAVLEPAPPEGWMAAAEAKAVVSVQSLFGEPAPGRRVTVKAELSPAGFGFGKWPGYTFYLGKPAGEDGVLAGRTLELGEQETDAAGRASFVVPFDTLKQATFRADLVVEAYEREGGRSVRQVVSQLVSARESVVGWKADGDTGYIPKDGGRAVRWVAVGRDLAPLARKDLRRRLVEIRQVSVLTQLDNGNHAYVSTRKERVLEEGAVECVAGENVYELPTAKAGDFRVEWVDGDREVVCAVPFTVVGKAEAGDVVDREAELRLQVSAAEVLPGGEVEVHLSAPYAGAGLVTLERERVHAAVWFRTEGKDAVVRMRIPEGAEGSYYLNAAFIRATSSPEVFYSPLSYAAAPLRVLAPGKVLECRVEAPREVRPGTEAAFVVRTGAPARVVVYAVDEGIHQITGYKLPKPLDFFLRKQALEVRTQQWLDLLLPEYRFMTAPAFGGDGGGEDLPGVQVNPFKRREEAPVVYWSGIVDCGPDGVELKWRVPDYFNGNLRVMAVAGHAGAVGSVEAATLVKAPLILQPNVPLFVAPGDEFDSTLTIFNHLEEAGETGVAVEVKPSGGLEVVGDRRVVLPLRGKEEGVVRFRLRAGSQLGAAELAFAAEGGGESVGSSVPLSVRPASAHRTVVTTGWFRTGEAAVAVKRNLHEAYRRVEAVGGAAPLGLARGLEAYVREYPYGCSEQVVSRAMTKLVVATEADFGLEEGDAARAVEAALRMLAARQRADGGFGYWYADANNDYEFHSLHVLHFLTEAKMLDYVVPEAMLKGALSYAGRTARAKVEMPWQADMQALAVYLLARNGVNCGPQLLNLRDTLDSRFKGAWQARASAAWVAAAYRLLKKEGEAGQVLDACLKARAGGGGPKEEDFYFRTRMMDDLVVFYVQCRHFPERAKSFGIAELDPVMVPLRDQGFNTLACSYLTLALKAYGDVAKGAGLQVAIHAVDAGGKDSLLGGPSGGLVRAGIAPGTASVRFVRTQEGAGDVGAFYQVVEQGFDREPPAELDRSGLEVVREFVPVVKERPLRVGDPVEVVLRVRNVSGRALANLAVVDLMPAGFEVVPGDLRSGPGTVAGADYCELREDRTLFFVRLPANGEWQVKYRVKAVVAGVFTVPPALAEDMYDRGIHGTTAPGKVEVAAGS